LITTNAFGATTAIVFVACRLLIGLFPDWSFTITQSWFHGIELTKLGSWNLTVETFVLGLVTVTVGTWLVGVFWPPIFKISFWPPVLTENKIRDTININ
jgi:hypothetical protein